MLQSMGLQRVGHELVTEQQQHLEKIVLFNANTKKEEKPQIYNLNFHFTHLVK